MTLLTSLATVENNFKDKIYTIRNIQVMLDEDLAFLYKVKTERLNEQVKRNLSRFPEEFCFQLTKTEFENLKSQFATSSLKSQFVTSSLDLRSQFAISNKRGGRRYLPYVFTEQGVAMLSAWSVTQRFGQKMVCLLKI